MVSPQEGRRRANLNADMRSFAIRRAAQSEIKVEQQVMQQNQRDGTQPELFQNRVRAIWFQRLRKKVPQPFRAVNLCDVPARDVEPNKKRPGKPGRSLLTKEAARVMNP
jgi:hypothetical protein